MDQKWTLNSNGLLVLVDPFGTILYCEKKSKPSRTIKTGGRAPGRPSKAELALVEKSLPIRRHKLYEYDSVIGISICNAIVAGENIKALNPKHKFPPFRVIREWVKQYPQFAENVKDSEDTRSAIRFERSMERIKADVQSGAFKAERKGRPLGSQNRRPTKFIIVEGDNSSEINWSDVPMLITRFGSYEAAMEYKKSLMQK